MTKQQINPASPLYQASILQDGFSPSDGAKAVMASELAGQPPDGPVPDEVQVAQMIDPPTYSTTNAPLKPPPGSYRGHVDIGDDETQHNLLSDKRYSLLGDYDD